MGEISDDFDQMAELLQTQLKRLIEENNSMEQEILAALNDVESLYDSFREFKEELDSCHNNLEQLEEQLHQLEALDRQEAELQQKKEQLAVVTTAKYVKLEEKSQRFESAINFPMTKLHSLEQLATKLMNGTNGDGADVQAQEEAVNLMAHNGARSPDDEAPENEFMDVL